MPQRTGSSYFHLHLVSDATGETLTTVARGATAQYPKVSAVEHVYPLVRTQNRLLGLRAHHDADQYIDRKAVAEEVAFSRKLCVRHNWPSIDVTRRSIEETAAAVMSFLAERRRQPVA